MKFVTFNIRCDFDQDGNNSFRFRKPLILKKIQAESPDILCFQEVLPHVADWLSENLPDYVVVGCGRGPQLDDEQMTVAFKKNRFSLIQMNTFWLSPTPFVPASRYEEQSPCPRTCTEVVLQERNTPNVLRVLNTHLDHIGAKARTLGLRQILRYLDQVKLFPDAPVLLAGDFNAQPEDEEMSIMKEYPEFKQLTKEIGVTYHGYQMAAEPGSIDYIFLRGNFECTGIEKWTEEENGVFLSDHYPVCACLERK